MYVQYWDVTHSLLNHSYCCHDIDSPVLLQSLHLQRTEQIGEFFKQEHFQTVFVLLHSDFISIKTPLGANNSRNLTG